MSMSANACISDPSLGRPGASPKCFLHIPKSAGSSIHSALEAALPPGSLAPQRTDPWLFCGFNDFELLRPEARSLIAANLPEVQSLGRYRAVSGHFSLTTLLQIADQSSIATVLREPRARLLSLYTYWRTPGLNDHLAPYRAYQHAQRPLSEFLFEPLLAPTIDNQVCRMLLHGDPRLPEADFAAQSDIESIASDAIERLDGLGFVGILELDGNIWQGLERLFGVKLNPTRLNVTDELGSPTPLGPEEKLITAEVLDLIEERNAADLLVYDHALTRAGVDADERRRLTDGAFAGQLVKLGDLVGYSAARAAEQAGVVEVLRSRLEERERSHMGQDEIHDGPYLYEQTIQTLKEEIRHRDEDLDKLRRWLASVHASASWRLTAPLRAVKHRIQRLLR